LSSILSILKQSVTTILKWLKGIFTYYNRPGQEEQLLLFKAKEKGS